MKLLSQMVEQYQRRHNCLPKKIVLTPLAMTGLAVKRTVGPVWNGVPVECREITSDDVVASGPCLGLDLDGNQLVSFDIKE